MSHVPRGTLRATTKVKPLVSGTLSFNPLPFLFSCCLWDAIVTLSLKPESLEPHSTLTPQSLQLWRLPWKSELWGQLGRLAALRRNLGEAGMTSKISTYAESSRATYGLLWTWQLVLLILTFKYFFYIVPFIPSFTVMPVILRKVPCRLI